MSNKISQRDAVYQVITEIVKRRKGYFKTFPLNTTERTLVEVKLLDMFKADKISGEVDEDKRPAYVTGLVSNWLRKDERYEELFRMFRSEGPAIMKTTPSIGVITQDDIDKYAEEYLELTRGVINGEDMIGIPTVDSRQDEDECECGAKHTSNPNFHSNWCPAKK